MPKDSKPLPARARANRLPSQGAGQGEGWGGPAKGPGTGSRPLLIPGQPPAKREASATKAMGRADRVQFLEDVLFDLAMHAERDETRVAAASKLHAIYEGSPVAKMITAQVDDVSRMSDAELQTELARLQKIGGGPG